MSSSSDSTSSPQGKFTKVGSKRQNKRQKREDKARAIADLRNRASEKTQTHVEPRYNEPGEGKKGKAKAQFGRRITPESKTLPKVQVEEVHTAPKEPELADLRGNRYFVKSWLTHSPSSRHPGAARWAGNLKAGSERPKMPKAPLNLSHEVWQKLRSIFAGEGCPLFAKEMDMNKANVQRPVYNYCIIALIRAMVEQWASDDGKMIAHDLCFLQSDQYFQVFLDAVCALAERETWEITVQHWSQRFGQFAIRSKRVKVIQVLIKHELKLLKIGELDADAYPRPQKVLAIGGHDVDDPVTLDLLAWLGGSTFLEICPMKPAGYKGSIGQPIPELAWESEYAPMEFHSAVQDEEEVEVPADYQASAIAIGGVRVAPISHFRERAPVGLGGVVLMNGQDGNHAASFVLGLHICQRSDIFEDKWIPNLAKGSNSPPPNGIYNVRKKQQKAQEVAVEPKTKETSKTMEPPKRPSALDILSDAFHSARSTLHDWGELSLQEEAKDKQIELHRLLNELDPTLEERGEYLRRAKDEHMLWSMS